MENQLELMMRSRLGTMQKESVNLIRIADVLNVVGLCDPTGPVPMGMLTSSIWSETQTAH
jgi:hypothetical protein